MSYCWRFDVGEKSYGESDLDNPFRYTSNLTVGKTHVVIAGQKTYCRVDT